MRYPITKFLEGHGQWWNVNAVFNEPPKKEIAWCYIGEWSGRFGHVKTEHTERLLLLRRHLGNWPLGPAVSMRSELLVAHEKLGQLPLLTVYVVPV
jgi:hypothetical protein